MKTARESAAAGKPESPWFLMGKLIEEHFGAIKSLHGMSLIIRGAFSGPRESRSTTLPSILQYIESTASKPSSRSTFSGGSLPSPDTALLISASSSA